MDSSDTIGFYILAFVAIASALAMILTKNTIYSAVFLVMNFLSVAVFYLALGAPFIGMVQVTVYAGAIMVLFLFVIMLLGVERNEAEDTLRWQKPFTLMLAGMLLFVAYYIFTVKGVTDAVSSAFPAGFGDPKAIGLVLFNEYLLPFEVTGVLLLVAMIGAVVLTKGSRPKVVDGFAVMGKEEVNSYLESSNKEELKNAAESVPTTDTKEEDA